MRRSGSVRPSGTTGHPGCSSRWKPGPVPPGSGSPCGRVSCRENDDDALPGYIDRMAVKRSRTMMMRGSGRCGDLAAGRGAWSRISPGDTGAELRFSLRAVAPAGAWVGLAASSWQVYMQPVMPAARDGAHPADTKDTAGSGAEDRKGAGDWARDRSAGRRRPPVWLTGRRRRGRRDEETAPMRRRPRPEPVLGLAFGRTRGRPACRSA